MSWLSPKNLPGDHILSLTQRNSGRLTGDLPATDLAATRNERFGGNDRHRKVCLLTTFSASFGNDRFWCSVSYPGVCLPNSLYY